MRELARLADSLVEQVAETRRQYEQLRTELGGVEPADAPPRQAQRAESSPEDDHERIRLFALNLALSGASRDDVHTELHNKFEMDDTSDILDAVFPQSSPTLKPKRRFGRRNRGG